MGRFAYTIFIIYEIVGMRFLMDHMGDDNEIMFLIFKNSLKKKKKHFSPQLSFRASLMFGICVTVLSHLLLPSGRCRHTQTHTNAVLHSFAPAPPGPKFARIEYYHVLPPHTVIVIVCNFSSTTWKTKFNLFEKCIIPLIHCDINEK